jgi:hypothetical protein
MNERKFKLVQWLLYGLMALSALLTVLFYINPSNPDVILYWMYIIFIVSVVILLGISFVNMIKNPKGSFKVLLIIVGMIVVGIIAYSVSKNTLDATQMEKYGVTASTVKWVSAGLILTYAMMIASVAVFIYTAFYKFIKK